MVEKGEVFGEEFEAPLVEYPCLHLHQEFDWIKKLMSAPLPAEKRSETRTYRSCSSSSYYSSDMSAAEGIKFLTIADEREHHFVRNTDLHTTVHTNYTGLRQDLVLNINMAAYHISSKTALCSTNDGDYLFNSFIAYLVGNVSRSIELHYRCSL
ncbi:hypothetical protein CHS0354_026974 [Potamilus streckersoni]|uniref:Uncharacterized protein n=1 Tax=Potamilus streckersoni TaxID=2493646 RepID=A0AAE0SCH3_9BIVA|nr:hypothetical protein CHS0354_026974 [Potamilus streckersoni]